MSNIIQQVMEWWHKYDNSEIVIKTESNEFTISISDSRLPHFLGMHYTSEKRLKGRTLYNFIKEKDDETIFGLIKRNYPQQLENVKNRVKYFKYFMEHLAEAILVNQTHENSKLHSSFLLVKKEDGTYLQLGIAHDREDTDYFETFLVEYNNQYFKNSNINEKIISIEKWEQDKLVPFSFKETEKDMESKKNANNQFIDVVKEHAIHYFSLDEEYRNQDEIKKQGITLNPELFAYLSENDRRNKDYIILAIKENPKMFHFVADDVKTSIESIIMFSKINPGIMQHVPEKFLHKSIQELEELKANQEKMKNFKCKVINEPKISLRKGSNGKEFHVINFRVETNEKEKISCSAFNDKIIELKDLKEGDFVKLFGEVNITHTESKSYLNLKVLKAYDLREKEFLGYQEKKFNRSQVSAEQLKQSVLIEEIGVIKYGLTPMKKSRKYQSFNEMDSMVIYQDNSFYRFSRRTGGSVIDFVMMMEECDAKQALSIVKNFFLENNIELNTKADIKSEKIEKMILPQPDKDNKHVYRYLTEERKIEPAVVKEWIKEKRLYQDIQKNCIFVGMIEGNPLYATKRSTYASFKGDVENSIKTVGVYVNNQSDKLLVVESAIDGMSLQTLWKDAKEYDLLCLGGVGAAKETVERYIKDKPFKNIIVGLDQDEWGMKAMNDIKQFIHEEYPDIQFKILQVNDGCKDFNELLVKRVEQQKELQNQKEMEYR